MENGHNLPELPACRRLILEIIYRAARDAQSANRHHRLGALAYFASDNYTADLDALGLPYHWLPDGVDCPQTAQICPLRRFGGLAGSFHPLNRLERLSDRQSSIRPFFR
jgi:hypothetical protein